ncbi:hypothetical protein NI17_003120 [Thermobifida halotolerans]|uniref:Uncharacterized protein n=1 Tax=Thermobifida halotolerans TaxID=483545 RepID=A0AA97M1F0_9ACTN|nr:hypothetical protein [Thermobifida halotolerans]UOE22242.1 hypothetical protein NI17_003120 [Thermobifida halotolerans]
MSDRGEKTDGTGGRAVYITEADETAEQGALLAAVDEGDLDNLLAGETEEHIAPEAVLRAFELYQENLRA